MVKRNAWGLSAALAALLVCGGPAWGQFSIISPTSPGNVARGGAYLSNATAYAGYSSIHVPDSLLYGAAPYYAPVRGLGSDVDLGGSVTFGWSRPANKKTNFSLLYTTAFAARAHNSAFNSLNQYLALNTGRNRRLSPRWSYNLSGAIGENDLRSFLFVPAKLTRVAGSPGTFDDLSAAMVAGKYTNDQLASILTGAPVIESPARAALFGDRLLSASLGGNLSYAKSQRLSFRIGAGSSYNLHRPDKDRVAAGQYAYLLPRDLGINGSVGMSFALTPRTRLGLDATSTRSISKYYSSYATNLMASVGRVMGKRWFVQAQGGSGFITPVRGYYRSADTALYLAGGALGYRTYEHTFMVSHNRTVGDTYGIGTSTQQTTHATWVWSRPGRSWWLYTSVANERFGERRLGQLTGWLGSAGLARALSAHLTLHTQYSYMTNFGANFGGFGPALINFPQYGVHVSSVRMMVVWAPVPRSR